MSDPDPTTALRECPVCGAIGLAERIEDYDCRTFLSRTDYLNDGEVAEQC